MRYQHRFAVNAPLDDVVRFHSQSASMAAITPPPIIVRVHAAPSMLDEGDTMDFTMWLGPLPVRWLARIEQKSGASFVDRQVRGPFEQWEHLHTFVPVDAERTVVIDQVTARLGKKWFWKGIGLSMWLGLPILFAYRGWRTRRLLDRKRDTTAMPAPTASSR